MPGTHLNEPGGAPGGPLEGLRVVDVSSLAPGPFCTMILADFGAEVISVEPPAPPAFDVASFFTRGKRSVLADLRQPAGAAAIARLVETADVFVEGFRPGTMERLGLGPEHLCERNPRLVYTRITGWGQDGPYASVAGHDINFIAIAGALGVLGPEPSPPLNLVGDFASGSVTAVVGTVLALFAREHTGRGQVVDAAMVDGAAQLISAQLAMFSRGRWRPNGADLLDGSAPFYGVYRCADGRCIAVGAVEPKFYRSLLANVGAEPELASTQFDESTWPATRARLQQLFATRPRDTWMGLFAGTDACVSPVLALEELEHDRHLRTRGTVVQTVDGLEAAPAPRLAATPARPGPKPRMRGEHTVDTLLEAGLSRAEIDELLEAGVVAGPER
jgi:alpha-methylacyl-CoA racemase